jgi:hypothetical protein
MEKTEKYASLNELAADIHRNAVDHGWWDEPRSFGDIIALCHSELSEALEEYRSGKEMVYFTHCKCKENGGLCVPDEVNECPNNPEQCGAFEFGKPEGVAVEMIDCIIRILDWCGKEGVDVDALLVMKHEYNKTRPYRHGGKAL